VRQMKLETFDFSSSANENGTPRIDREVA